MMTSREITRAKQIIEAWPNYSDASVAKMIGGPRVSEQAVLRIRRTMKREG
jgi:hypothetical protein